MQPPNTTPGNGSGNGNSNGPHSNTSSPHPHPMLSYYQNPMNLQPFSAGSPFSSGFSIPTSNSRPGSRNGTVHAFGEDSGSEHNHIQGGGMGGYGPGGGGGAGGIDPTLNSISSGMGMPGMAHLGQTQGGQKRDWSALSSQSPTQMGQIQPSSYGSTPPRFPNPQASSSSTGVFHPPQSRTNSVDHPESKPIINLSQPPAKKRKVSPSAQTHSGSNNNHTASASSFLSGLRGAEELTSPGTGGGDDDDEGSEGSDGGDGSDGGEGGRGGRGGKDGDKKGKQKLTRGSRACTVCRRLKMKCVEADVENGISCLRCRNGGLECVFEQSMRGKRSTKGKKSDIMAKNLKEMENTLETVLRNLHNPKLSLASGMTNMSGVAGSSAGMSPDGMSPEKDLAGHSLLERQMSVQGHSPLGAVSDAATPASLHKSGTNPIANSSNSPRLHSLPDNTLNPLGLLAEASLQNRKRPSFSSPHSQGTHGENMHVNSVEAGLRGFAAVAEAEKEKTKEGETPRRLGIGDASYFKPGPMSLLGLRRVFIERELKPEILTFMTAAQINDLFDIFFDKMHRFIPLLNRELHTPAAVCARSPFLLTTICAIASRFYPKHPELRAKLTPIAKKLMFDRPSRGYKSLEIVQAYLLLTGWTLGPEERWEQDLTYILLGLAIRVATDLNLFKRNSVVPLDTEEGRLRDKEIANRERTWLICFVLDRSMSAQMGKPYSVREDTIVKECHYPSWYSRPAAQPEDQTIAAYVVLQRIMARALDSLYSPNVTNASGLLPGVDYPLVVHAVQEQLDGWQKDWQHALPEADGPEMLEMMSFYQSISRLVYHYNSLVIRSFALQYAVETSPIDMPYWFNKVYSAASSVIAVVKHELAPIHCLPYLTDGYMVMVCYATLSLLKLIRPEFHSANRNPEETLNKIADMVSVLSEAGATSVDDINPLTLYAGLLRNLVTNKAEELKTTRNGKASRQTRSYGDVVDPRQTMVGGNMPYQADDEGEVINFYGNGGGIFPNTSYSNRQAEGMPPGNSAGHLNSMQMAQGGSASAIDPSIESTIWPNNTYSALPTPIAQMHSNGETMGMDGGNIMSDLPQMDGTGLGFAFDDMNWENSLLMPGFGNFGQLGLSGGYIHTQFGSGIITPNIGLTPTHSRPASPRMNVQS